MKVMKLCFHARRLVSIPLKPKIPFDVVTCVVCATHLPVSGPASLECSTVAGTPTLILCSAAG